MKNQSDEQLVSAYREGRAEAADVLMERYKPLVLRQTSARFLVGGDRDDLIQEGMIGLYKAIRDYDAEKAASFSTFASLCVDRQIMNAIEAAQRAKNQPLNSSVPLLDKEWEDEAAVADSPEKIVIEQVTAGERLSEIRRKLSPLERKVLELNISGLDYREIAKRLGKEPKSVDNALQRIRKKTQKK